MKPEFYEKLNRKMTIWSGAALVMSIVNGLCTAVIVIIYAFFFFLIAGSSLLGNDCTILLIPLISIPATGFLFVTALRMLLNFPRPYDLYEVKPYIEKKTSGRSFPSRHVFSAFVIASSLAFVDLNLSIICIIPGIVLGVMRVLAGVHFIRDVACGALFGTAWGIAGLVLFHFTGFF